MKPVTGWSACINTSACGSSAGLTVRAESRISFQTPQVDEALVTCSDNLLGNNSLLPFLAFLAESPAITPVLIIITIASNMLLLQEKW